jgi:hypothetical protein
MGGGVRPNEDSGFLEAQEDSFKIILKEIPFHNLI